MTAEEQHLAALLRETTAADANRIGAAETQLAVLDPSIPDELRPFPAQLHARWRTAIDLTRGRVLCCNDDDILSFDYNARVALNERSKRLANGYPASSFFVVRYWYQVLYYTVETIIILFFFIFYYYDYLVEFRLCV